MTITIKQVTTEAQAYAFSNTLTGGTRVIFV
jgi:hypothetical protein